MNLINEGFGFKRLINSRWFIFTVVAVIYVIASVKSIGYYHPDEHFQILEFANFKMGKLSATQLPWEFGSQIRSSFLPWIAFGVIKILGTLGITNPYSISLILRIITGAVAIYTIDRFSRSLDNQIDSKNRNLFYWLSYLLWFLPFLNVRFSSECWGSLFFLFGMSFLYGNQLKNDRLSFILCGVFCGFSFLCRFQCGIMFFGLLFWMYFVKHESLKRFLAVIASFLTIIFVGVLLDRIFYGVWTLSFFNYFVANIIGDVASSFGVSSWFSYVFEIVFHSIFLIGILILLSLVILFVAFPSSLILWVVLPFFIIHLLIPHKELRFLFPLCNFIPFILIKGYELCFSVFRMRLVPKSVITVFLYLVGLVNLTALVPCIWTAPSGGCIAIAKYIHDNYKEAPVNLYYFQKEEGNPFQPYSFLRQSFYEQTNLKSYHVLDYDSLSRSMFNSDTIGILVLKKRELLNSVMANKLRSIGLREIKTGVLPWVSKIEDIYDKFSSYNEYILYGK